MIWNFTKFYKRQLIIEKFIKSVRNIRKNPVLGGKIPLIKWKDYNDSYAEITYTIYIKCQEFTQDEIFAVPKITKILGICFRSFQKWMYFAGINFCCSQKISLFQFNLTKWHKNCFLCWTLQLCSKISHLFDRSFLTQALL